MKGRVAASAHPAHAASTKTRGTGTNERVVTEPKGKERGRIHWLRERERETRREGKERERERQICPSSNI